MKQYYGNFGGKNFLQNAADVESCLTSPVGAGDASHELDLFQPKMFQFQNEPDFESDESYCHYASMFSCPTQLQLDDECEFDICLEKVSEPKERMEELSANADQN